jgi:hypothetical protein
MKKHRKERMVGGGGVYFDRGTRAVREDNALEWAATVRGPIDVHGQSPLGDETERDAVGRLP